MLATLSETFWILVLALVALFAFFVALGAFSPGDVLGLTVVVVALALLWVAHAVWESRHRDPHDRAMIRARERRGF
jgi:membrane protein implicated in regulation of membrane protease activity